MNILEIPVIGSWKSEKESIFTLLSDRPLRKFEGLDVGFYASQLGVGDKDDAVDAFENQLTAGIVEHLAWHCVEVEARLESTNFT